MIGQLILLVPILFCLFSSCAWADLEIGKEPTVIELREKLGGRLDGTPWSSDEIQGKVSVLFYVDPDEKDLNEEASQALKARAFPLDKYQSFAVINMDATWLPNAAISSSLKKKQKQYPNTLYVRDNKKVLVSRWGLGDDTSDVLAFDRQGRLIFRKDGKLGEEEIRKLVQAVVDAIEK